MSSTLVDDVLDSIVQNCGPFTLAIIAQVSSSTRALALPPPHTKSRFEGCSAGIPVSGFHITIPAWVCPLPRKDVFGDEDVEGDHDFPSSQLAPMFACAITDMANLQLLEIGGNMEGAMKYSPELASAILGLTSLKSLTLHEVGLLASAALGKAAEAIDHVSYLQSLKLSLTLPSHHHSARQSPYFDQFLSHLSPNVVNLEISDFDLSRLISEADGPAVVFPSALRLEISPYSSSLQEISNAFPNIASLTLEPGNLPLHLDCPHQLFPHLIYLMARFDEISSILRSPMTARKKRVICCLEFSSENVALPALLSEIEGLQSLYFRQTPVRSLPWWQEFAEAVPDLVSLTVDLTAESLQDFDLMVLNHVASNTAQKNQGRGLPPLFSSVTLESEHVSTLKYAIIKVGFGSYTLDMAPCGFEILRSEDSVKVQAPIPGDDADRIRAEYEGWYWDHIVVLHTAKRSVAQTGQELQEKTGDSGVRSFLFFWILETDESQQAFNVVARILAVGKWVGGCFIYSTSNNRLCYFVGSESYAATPFDSLVPFTVKARKAGLERKARPKIAEGIADPDKQVPTGVEKDEDEDEDDDDEELTRSAVSPSYGKRRIPSLNFWTEHDTMPSLLAEVAGLGSVHFSQRPEFFKALPELVLLKATFNTESPQDFDLIG
ncbi:hypothetical protein BKA70DRAFT_1223028 [Coprinopsis sp. MPI-PUGE-AT-0042]|nr:hypothetical protein BKA70DRAFT_1223028 [Coprinopsis sp. MPI-PUGE-AT-0042]